MIENVADTLMSQIITTWFQLTEAKKFSLRKSFCLLTVSTYLHSITFMCQDRCSDRFPYWLRRSRYLNGLMCKSASVSFVGSRVWIQICVWNFLSLFCCVFCIGSGLCDKLVTHWEESYSVRVCLFVCVI